MIVNIGTGSAVRQQTITRTNVHPDPCRNITSVGHNESKLQFILVCHEIMYARIWYEHDHYRNENVL